MRLKEDIKSKVDRLNPSELRLVEILIDSLSGNRKIRVRKHIQKKPVYLDIIDLMKPAELTFNDIDSGRNERI